MSQCELCDLARERIEELEGHLTDEMMARNAYEEMAAELRCELRQVQEKSEEKTDRLKKAFMLALRECVEDFEGALLERIISIEEEE